MEGTHAMMIGSVFLWFALFATLAGMLAYLPGVRRSAGSPHLAVAHTAVYASAAGLLATTATLWYLILTHQFQYSYVFRYSSLDMPLRYVIASLWGGQEGTFLLWATYGGLFAVFLRFKARQYEAAVNFFYMGITFFLLMILAKANPFVRLDTVPPDGNGLNPLLQDPWMTIHPPIMFMGFAALGIPAAFAMAALIKEDWDNWVPRALPWTIFGVLALGTGLTLGGYWSYSILGWGGYWGWDPVENSSLVPWLFAVTLLHTEVIQMRRGLFRRANLILSLLPFILVTYSTFLTRSGVLADFSVHSFTDLGINQFLVAFMVVFLGGGLALFFWKVRRVPVEKSATPFFSREYFMFLGALAFGLFGAFVCLGTSTPVISRFIGGPANVEPAFYNRIGLPFIIMVTVLMGLAPHFVWQRTVPGKLLRRLGWAVALSVLSVPAYFFAGIRHPGYLAMMAAGTFAFLSNLQVALTIMRRRWSAAGGYIAHAGVGLIALGVLTSTAYDSSKIIELPKDADVQVLNYTMRYLGDRPVEAGRKNAYDVLVTQNGSKTSYILSPTMYYSEFNGGMMKKPAIQSFLSHDIYVAPGGLLTEKVGDRVKTTVVLSKHTPRVGPGMTLTFKDFNTEGAMVSEGKPPVSVGAAIEVEVAGTTHDLELKVNNQGSGPMQVVPVAVPGTDYVLTLDGIDATGGRVQVGIGPPPIEVAEGESVDADGYHITLNAFDVDMGKGRGTKIEVYADTHMEAGGKTYHLRPGIINRANMDPEFVEAPIGETGLNLILAGVDANSRTASFYMAPPPKVALWVEASTKPFILLLWLGTGFVIVGLLVATIFRGRLAGKLAARLGGRDRGDRRRRAA